MGQARTVDGGLEIPRAPLGTLEITENPSVFQHFHLLGFIGRLQEPLGAHLEPSGASGSLLSSPGSFRELILSLWEFIFKLWELLGAHFQAPGASGSLFLSRYATISNSLGH